MKSITQPKGQPPSGCESLMSLPQCLIMTPISLQTKYTRRRLDDHFVHRIKNQRQQIVFTLCRTVYVNNGFVFSLLKFLPNLHNSCKVDRTLFRGFCEWTLFTITEFLPTDLTWRRPLYWSLLCRTRTLNCHYIVCVLFTMATTLWDCNEKPSFEFDSVLLFASLLFLSGRI